MRKHFLIGIGLTAAIVLSGYWWYTKSGFSDFQATFYESWNTYQIRDSVFIPNRHELRTRLTFCFESLSTLQQFKRGDLYSTHPLAYDSIETLILNQIEVLKSYVNSTEPYDFHSRLIAAYGHRDFKTVQQLTAQLPQILEAGKDLLRVYQFEKLEAAKRGQRNVYDFFNKNWDKQLQARGWDAQSIEAFENDVADARLAVKDFTAFLNSMQKISPSLQK